MNCMFEVFVAPGHESETLLSDGVINETAAAEMTEAEAQTLAEQNHLPALPPNQKGVTRKFIVCLESDLRLVANRLEGSNACSGFQVHHL
ncbi:MAG: hypothetical protein HY908_18125 [Myxococcales bacterium]|nr:hypothetical protein [Myxococcales bacterium]